MEKASYGAIIAPKEKDGDIFISLVKNRDTLVPFHAQHN